MCTSQFIQDGGRTSAILKIFNLQFHNPPHFAQTRILRLLTDRAESYNLHISKIQNGGQRAQKPTYIELKLLRLAGILN